LIGALPMDRAATKITGWMLLIHHPVAHRQRLNTNRSTGNHGIQMADPEHQTDHGG
jgi:hypothetical protein